MEKYIVLLIIGIVATIIGKLITNWRKKQGIKTPYEKKIIAEYEAEKAAQATKAEPPKDVESYPSFADKD